MTPEIEKRIKLVKAGKVPAGYKKTRIGVVPEEWRIGDLSEVLELTLREVEKPSKPYWRVGVRSWAKGTFRAYVDDPSSVDMDTLYQVKENDLVVSITFAWEHAIALATKEDDGLLVSHRFPTYVFKKNHLPIFYQKFVSQPIFKYMLELVSPGGAGRNRVLDKKNFIKLPCPILKFKEQEKIAEILATQDRVIELKEKLVVEKQKQKKFLMQQLLSTEKKNDIPMKFSLDGVNVDKKKWKNTKFEEFVYSAGKRNKDNVDLIPYAITNESGFVPQNQAHNEFGYMKNTDRTAYNIVSTNSFAYNPARINVGSIGYYCGSNDVIVSSLYEVFKTSEIVDDVFLWFWFKSDIFPIWIKKLQEGSVRQYFYYDKLCKCEIHLPSLPEQQAIAKVLSTADEEISLLQKDLEQEKLKKKSLMQLLLTGLVRVSA